MSADCRDDSPHSEHRTQRLEAQVRLLCAVLDLHPSDLTAVVPHDVVELARAGEQTKAIRLLRKQTGLGLVAAMRMVDAVSYE